jgi:predicted transcriptional regulator
LYVTGGNGAVGSFDVGRVVSEPVEDLWARVGRAATTRTRFDQYFRGFANGCGIEVLNPVRFKTSLPLEELRRVDGALLAPQSFRILRVGDPVRKVLEHARANALAEMPKPVKLRPIAQEERARFKKLVIKHIAPNYDDIDESFAETALLVHDLGHDPVGFFTTTKEVLAIESNRGALLGFTTLTYKGGKAVKTGPTILFSRYRRKGFGLATRRAIEHRAYTAGARKVYCTCPDTADDVVRYLLASGMKVEAHLTRQYTADHGELVLGKFLVADEPSLRPPSVLRSTAAAVVPPQAFSRKALVDAFGTMFAQTWYAVDAEYSREIVRQCLSARPKGLPSKPKRMICLRARGQCVAALILMPKRGGAVKGILVRRTTDQASITSLVNAGIAEVVRTGGRKVYLPIPVDQSDIRSILQSLGFAVEGVLRAPYVPGQDTFVFARFL